MKPSMKTLILCLFALFPAALRADLDASRNRELSLFARSLRAQYRLDFKTRSAGPFLIAYRSPEATVRHLTRYLERFHAEIYPRYFDRQLAAPIRVVCFETQERFVRSTGSDAYGFYTPAVKTLTTWASSGHGTLWHELIHAYIDANADREPQEWFSEGLASFYERAFLENDAVSEGYVNWRHPQLVQAVNANRCATLDDFMRQNRMREGYGYAQARFLFCYLWTRKQMVPFVRAYLYELCPRFSGAELGARAVAKMEGLIGADIAAIDGEFRALVLRVRKNQKL